MSGGGGGGGGSLGDYGRDIVRLVVAGCVC
jgi:hypothetical protein